MSKTITCPKCSSAVKGATGLGMVECPKCGEYLLIGGEDLPEIKDASERPVSSGGFSFPKVPKLEVETVFSLGPDQQDESNRSGGLDSGLKAREPKADEPESHGAGAQGAAGGRFEAGVDAQGEVHAEGQGDAQGLPPIPPHIGTPGLGTSEEPLRTTVLDVDYGDLEQPLPKAASPEFQDVLEYGNQVQPSQDFGALVYDVHIGGIDTVEVRKELSQCLQDKRLGIDVQRLLAQIKEGEMILEKLNPVKASVLLNRLRHFPFKISWSSRQLVKDLTAWALIFSTAISMGVGFGQEARAAEWARHEINLKGMAIKIENLQDDIRALIEKKKESKSADEKEELMKDIVKKNGELKKIYKDFKAEKEHVRFEHPEQGDKTERAYRHLKLKSLEELQDETGLDGQLSRLKKKVETSYETTLSGSPVADAVAEPRRSASPKK